MSLEPVKQEIITTLLGNVSSWSADGQTRLAESMRAFDLRKGEKLTWEADEGDLLCYLVHGEAGVSINKSQPLPLRAETGMASFRVPERSTAQITARSDDCQLVTVDEDRLDFVAGWELLHGETVPASDEDAVTRLSLLNNPLVFRHLPFANVLSAMRRMKPQRVEANEIVVAEGDIADAFFVIENGRAEVWRTAPGKPQQEKVAELGVGDAFGEEALITGEPRNATVRMVAPGVLLVLRRDDFFDLVEKPLVNEVDRAQAEHLLEEGYVALNVGYEKEVADPLLTGEVISIPLPELRQRMDEVSNSKRYLTFCRSGRWGAVAAMLLREQGIEAVSLRGGVKDRPDDVGS